MFKGTNKEKLREHANIGKKWKGTRTLFGDPHHRCFPETIEFMNGTFIGVKYCLTLNYCNSSIACAGPGISFIRTK